jgi:hypothetical protein
MYVGGACLSRENIVAGGWQIGSVISHMYLQTISRVCLHGITCKT